MTKEKSQSPLPLAGIRVIDFSRLLPGPWSTQTLGDLGADVIKIEQPVTGDYSRHNPPKYAENSVYFSNVNRNKRSVVLDMTKEEDRAAAHCLIKRSDIVVESFRPGVAIKLGIDYETVSKSSPRLVYCSLNGFGSDGPLAGMAGHDLSLQGLTGLLGKAEAPPPVPGFQSGDYAAGAYATIGILAALIRRGNDGHGCRIEVPMYDSLIAWSHIMLSGAMARMAGFSGRPELEVWGGNPRYNTYRTRDGKAVTVSLLEPLTWKRFCHHIGNMDLIDHDEDWSHRHSDHGDKAPLYREAITNLCNSLDRDELCERMARVHIPICPAYEADEVLQSSEARASQVLQWVDHPRDGRIPLIRDPLARSGLSDPARRPAPGHGEHTDEVLRDIDRAG
jgi:crotonobetainyl-CoA:carnitine CoA-transferase CaiB-like acyl-CoA transferase